MRSRLGLVAVAAALLLAAGCGDDAAQDEAGQAGAEATSAAPTITANPSDSISASPSPTESGSATAPSSAVPTGPECATTWAGDAKLPKGYQGCVGEGGWVAADRLGCSSGQALVRYADTFWAVPGGTIHATEGLDSDQGYRDAIASCRG
jgi:hypothetical protein